MVLSSLHRGGGLPGSFGGASEGPSHAGGNDRSLPGQVEYQAGRFFREVTQPAMVVGMGAGLSAYNASRALVQPALVRSSLPLFKQVPFLIRATSAALSTVPEVVAFWGSSKVIEKITHPGRVWPGRNDAAREMAGLAMTLGFLKTFGFAARGLGGWAAHQNIPGLPKNPLAWSQLGMLTGIMAGHGAEIVLGWRPGSNPMQFLAESFITLGHFNAGGALSHALLPELYAANAGLQTQLARMESEQIAGTASRIPRLTNLNGLQNKFAPAGAEWRINVNPGSLEPGILITKMASLSQPPMEKGPLPRVHPELEAGKYRPQLSSRRGDKIGPFEERGSDESLATEAVRTLQQKALEEEKNSVDSAKSEGRLETVDLLATQLGVKAKPAKTVDPAVLSQVSPGEYGFAVGNILRLGMEEFFQPEVQRALQGKKINDLSQGELTRFIHAMDNLMDLALYLPRLGLVEANEGYRQGLGEGSGQIEDLKRGLIELLSPQIGVDVLSMEEGALSHGWGAMLSFLSLLRHQIKPGGLSWRYQLVTTGTKPTTAERIRTTGHYEEKIGDNVIHFKEDPFILAVGPDGYGGLSQEAFHRSFRLQFLNLPSVNLHEIFTPDFLKGLPEDTDFVEAIKGLVGENRGRFSPGPGQQPSLLPFEFIDEVMRREARGDWGVTHVPGFIPADYLFRGKPVSLAFVGPEQPEHSGRSPRAERLAQLFQGGRNPYLQEVGVSHHRLSSELGGAMKNIAGVIAGFESMAWAGENHGKDLDARAIKSALAFDILEPLEQMLLETLVNENVIKHGAIKFRSEVMTDLRSCLSLNLEAVRALYIELMNSPDVPLYQEDAFVDWAYKRIISRRKEFAETRNPVMGIILGAAEELNSKRGASLSIPKIVEIIAARKILTTEGINGLHPFVQRNQYPKHPIHLRWKHPKILKIHNLIHRDQPARPNLEIPAEILDALNEKFIFLEGEKVQQGLEGKNQASIDLLSDELFRYLSLEEMVLEHPDNERLKAKRDRQILLLPKILTAMEEGNPEAVYDFPFYQDPFQLAAQVRLEKTTNEKDQTVQPYYSYLRINGPAAMDQLTLLGRYLRSFGEAPQLRLDVDVTGLATRDRAMDKHDVVSTLPEILSAFLAHNKDAKIKLYLNGNLVVPSHYERVPWDEPVYHQKLEPLLDRINQPLSAGEKGVSAFDIRDQRYATSNLMNNLLKGMAGWGSLMRTYAGPIQRALKAGMTRPEKQTMIGIYSEGRLKEAFMIFRGSDGEAMALNHAVIKKLSEAYPEEYGPEGSRYPEGYRDIDSLHYFNGLPLKEFLESYERLAKKEGEGQLRYRMIELKSLPLELALAAKIPGINPAELHAFLNLAPTESRDNMFRDLENIYEMTPEEGNALTAKILQRYLNPFLEDARETLEGLPHYKTLHHAYETYGDHTLQVLILRGTERDLIAKMRKRVAQRVRTRKTQAP